MRQDANDSAPKQRHRRPAATTTAGQRSRVPDLTESYFLRFAESSDEVLWLADLHSHTLLYVSPRFEALWGVRADMLLNDPTHWNRAVLASDAKQLPMPFFADDPDGGETVREYRITSRHGETRWIRDRRFHLRDSDGTAVRVGGIAEDVTEGKEREFERENLLQREREARTAAEAVVAAKDEFLAVVTHELRSPLNAIRGWAHVLRQAAANLTPIQVKALEAIDRNTQAQAHLVDDLLDSQRILCGKLELSLSRVPLAELIDEAAAAVLPAAQAKRIRVEVGHDAAIGLVKADPSRLRQAIVKLMSNAVKFTPEDGIVAVRSTLRPECLAIQVQDTGIGLEPSQLPLVFERFQQADSSNTRRASGLGLGLSLAQQLVELHGGRIVAESEGAGLGAQFTVELPLHLLASGGQAAPAGASGSSLAGKRVVIVEDDNDGREVLGIILRGAQVELHSFDSAASAYDYLAQAPPEQQPDAMISDIAMPDEDGYDFIRRVRAMEGDRHSPHLVALALTSFTRAEDRLRALKAGFDAHVPKPIDPDTVLRSLECALGLSSNGVQVTA